MLSLCSDGGGVGKELMGEEPDREGSTDATGVLCGFRISRCGLRVEVCESIFSKDFVECRRVGAVARVVSLFLMCRPCGVVPPFSLVVSSVSCWADAEGIG